MPALAGGWWRRCFFILIWVAAAVLSSSPEWIRLFDGGSVITDSAVRVSSAGGGSSSSTAATAEVASSSSTSSTSSVPTPFSTTTSSPAPPSSFPFPGGRADAASCTDGERYTFLFGGLGGVSAGTLLADLWIFDAYEQTWCILGSPAGGVWNGTGYAPWCGFNMANTAEACAAVPTGAAWPSPRGGAVLAFHGPTQTLTLFGGYSLGGEPGVGSSTTYFNAGWRYSLATVTNASGAGGLQYVPGGSWARFSSPTTGHGGSDAAVVRTVATALSQYTDWPGPRAFPAAALRGDALYMVGGYVWAGATIANVGVRYLLADVWRLHLGCGMWSSLRTDPWWNGGGGRGGSSTIPAPTSILSPRFAASMTLFSMPTSQAIAAAEAVGVGVGVGAGVGEGTTSSSSGSSSRVSVSICPSSSSSCSELSNAWYGFHPVNSTGPTTTTTPATAVASCSSCSGGGSNNNNSSNSSSSSLPGASPLSSTLLASMLGQYPSVVLALDVLLVTGGFVAGSATQDSLDMVGETWAYIVPALQQSGLGDDGGLWSLNNYGPNPVATPVSSASSSSSGKTSPTSLPLPPADGSSSRWMCLNESLWAATYISHAASSSNAPVAGMGITFDRDASVVATALRLAGGDVMNGTWLQLSFSSSSSSSSTSSPLQPRAYATSFANTAGTPLTDSCVLNATGAWGGVCGAATIEGAGGTSSRTGESPSLPAAAAAALASAGNNATFVLGDIYVAGGQALFSTASYKGKTLYSANFPGFGATAYPSAASLTMPRSLRRLEERQMKVPISSGEGGLRKMQQVNSATRGIESTAVAPAAHGDTHVLSIQDDVVPQIALMALLVSLGGTCDVWDGFPDPTNSSSSSDSFPSRKGSSCPLTFAPAVLALKAAAQSQGGWIGGGLGGGWKLVGLSYRQATSGGDGGGGGGDCACMAPPGFSVSSPSSLNVLDGQQACTAAKSGGDVGKGLLVPMTSPLYRSAASATGGILFAATASRKSAGTACGGWWNIGNAARGAAGNTTSAAGNATLSPIFSIIGGYGAGAGGGYLSSKVWVYSAGDGSTASGALLAPSSSSSMAAASSAAALSSPSTSSACISPLSPALRDVAPASAFDHAFPGRPPYSSTTQSFIFLTVFSTVLLLVGLCALREACVLGLRKRFAAFRGDTEGLARIERMQRQLAVLRVTLQTSRAGPSHHASVREEASLRITAVLAEIDAEALAYAEARRKGVSESSFQALPLFTFRDSTVGAGATGTAGAAGRRSFFSTLGRSILLSTATTSSSPPPPVTVEATGEDCPVCLCSYEAGEALRRLPCDHYFHSACIERWLRNSSKACPTCKHCVLAAPPTRVLTRRASLRGGGGGSINGSTAGAGAGEASSVVASSAAAAGGIFSVTNPLRMITRAGRTGRRGR